MSLPNRFVTLLVALISLDVIPNEVAAKIVVLKNGTEVRGLITKVSSLGTDLYGGGAGGVDNQLIVLVDDGLRRVFFSRYQVESTADEVGLSESILLKGQPTQRNGAAVGTVGPYRVTTPFDERGRRTIIMRGPRGPLSIVQGITNVTPDYVVVKAIHSRPAMQWDMRLATSSIPRKTLSQIFSEYVDQENSEQRLKVVRLYLQAERYEDARAELERVISDFPDLADLEDQLSEIAGMHADQKIREMRLRRDAGQHHLVWNLLENFATENVAAEQLLEVQELHDQYSGQLDRITAAHSRVSGFVDGLSEGPLQNMMRDFQLELQRDLSVNTIERLADFERLSDDESLTAEQKLALALSGWLAGGSAADDLPLASSLWRTRGVVREYLVTNDEKDREKLLAQLGSEAAYTVEHLARLLAAMKPPLANPPSEEPAAKDDAQAEPTAEEPPAEEDNAAVREDGTKEPTIPTLEFFVEGVGGEEVRYLVQLPPEYDPYRRYPAVVTLHAAGVRPELQVDWWAGPVHPETGDRIGQATRHGYIVIAPAWTAHNQRQYHYSAREHAAVLFSLRDASQRFSIDTNRVYLSGHTMGGDAAWDLALAHPDLWAGAIPICATAEYGSKQAPRYVSQYWQNARHVSFYFVGGGKDGARLKRNSRDLNRYLTRRGIDAVVVEYRGRGQESFYDEVQHMFRWMNLQRRQPHELDFEVVAMRPWDNFFWWAEVNELPERSIVLPTEWPTRQPRPSQIEGTIRERRRVNLMTGASQATIWLSPDLVDFEQDVTVTINGKNRGRRIQPDVKVLLEDARRRGDRQHPFWASFEAVTGRRSR